LFYTADLSLLFKGWSSVSVIKEKYIGRWVTWASHRARTLQKQPPAFWVTGWKHWHSTARVHSCTDSSASFVPHSNVTSHELQWASWLGIS